MTLPALLFVALSVSGGFAVPLFAFSPPASPSGPGRSGRVPRGPRTLGIIAGLVAGKSVGILGATYLVARFTRASLDDDLPWVDVLDLAILGAWGSPCRSSSASSPSPRAANSTST